MSGKAIQIARLEKRFGQTDVLQGIDLDVRPGEFLTLLGESGCGKSTLLRLIAGFEPATSGTISIGGRDVGGLPPRARDIAMVFQSYALYPHMSVRDNIGMPLLMSRLSFAQRNLIGWASPAARRIRRQIDQDVGAVAGQLHLDHLLNRKPAQLSGGQRQRVAVGRAMVRKPSVFLMDEPLSNLDAKLRIQLREEIADLHRRTGITFIYVTHDQTEAMAMSDRIALMEGGRVVQCATPDDIYNQPSRLSVGRFIGTVAINEMPVEVRGGRIQAGGRDLGLIARGAADSRYTLAIRPEAIEAVSRRDRAHFVLPIVHTEFTGSDVGLRLSGAEIGTQWMRVQMRAEQFSQVKNDGGIGDRAFLRLRPLGALLFDHSGERVPVQVTEAMPVEARDVVPA